MVVTISARFQGTCAVAQSIKILIFVTGMVALEIQLAVLEQWLETHHHTFWKGNGHHHAALMLLEQQQNMFLKNCRLLVLGMDFPL